MFQRFFIITVKLNNEATNADMIAAVRFLEKFLEKKLHKVIATLAKYSMFARKVFLEINAIRNFVSKSTTMLVPLKELEINSISRAMLTVNLNYKSCSSFQEKDKASFSFVFQKQKLVLTCNNVSRLFLSCRCAIGKINLNLETIML